MAGRLVVGTSSWADPGFVEEWYPPGLPARDRLAWYAERFDAVEVNSTFYAIPDRRTVERWVTQTPDGFTFDVKLHRLLSRHAADLKSLPTAVRDRARTNERGRVTLEPGLEAAMLSETLAAVEPLAEAGKLSSLLLQLSPSFKPKAHELDELAPIVECLAPNPVAIEFRHRGWVEEKRLEGTLGWLSEHGAAFVCTDSPQGRAPTMMPPIDAVTRDDLAYLRAHGRNAEGYMKGKTVAERFAWEYDDDELRELAGRAEGLASEAEVVRMMFNNNRGADAPKAGERMRELLGQGASA
ncbi:MAG TPA: DUF72 domain-containing protein [Solirubrobacteraceae bacterium]|jgi:uncharacterized protein YecE (DUF72 family)